MLWKNYKTKVDALHLTSRPDDTTRLISHKGGSSTRSSAQNLFLSCERQDQSRSKGESQRKDSKLRLRPHDFTSHSHSETPAQHASQSCYKPPGLHLTTLLPLSSRSPSPCSPHPSRRVVRVEGVIPFKSVFKEETGVNVTRCRCT